MAEEILQRSQKQEEANAGRYATKSWSKALFQEYSCDHPSLRIKKAPRRAPWNYSAFGSAGLVTATVWPASPTLKRANRRTEIFSPSLPIFAAISCAIEMVWSLMKGCSSKQ